MITQFDDGLTACQYKATTSYADILGNMCYFVKNYLLKLFPKGYINDSYIDTRIVPLEQKKCKIVRKVPPYMGIRPTFYTDPEQVTAGSLPDFLYPTRWTFKNALQNYNPVLVDDKNDIAISMLTDRTKIEFDFVIVAETKMHQLNLANYLRQTVLHKNNYFYLNTVLDVEVPIYLVSLIAKRMHFDVKNDKEVMLKYLSKYGLRPIVEKKRMSTGNIGYFYSYPIKVLCQFPDYPSCDDGDTRGDFKMNFKVTDKMVVDFPAPFNYFLEMNLDRTQKQDIEKAVSMELEFNVADHGNIIMSHVADVKLMPTEWESKSFIKRMDYLTDTDEEFDLLDLTDFFPSDIKAVIDYCNKNAINPDDIFHFNVYHNFDQVNPDMTKINWKTYKFFTLKPEINSTYRLALYGDVERINRIIKRISSENEDSYQIVDTEENVKNTYNITSKIITTSC